jgi:LysM repeat protein
MKEFADKMHIRRKAPKNDGQNFLEALSGPMRQPPGELFALDGLEDGQRRKGSPEEAQVDELRALAREDAVLTPSAEALVNAEHQPESEQAEEEMERQEIVADAFASGGDGDGKGKKGEGAEGKKTELENSKKEPKTKEPVHVPDWYIIQKGDTFWALENRFGLPHGTLQQLNPTMKARKLKIGERMRIGGGLNQVLLPGSKEAGTNGRKAIGNDAFGTKTKDWKWPGNVSEGDIDVLRAILTPLVSVNSREKLEERTKERIAFENWDQYEPMSLREEFQSIRDLALDLIIPIQYGDLHPATNTVTVSSLYELLGASLGRADITILEGDLLSDLKHDPNIRKAQKAILLEIEKGIKTNTIKFPFTGSMPILFGPEDKIKAALQPITWAVRNATVKYWAEQKVNGDIEIEFRMADRLDLSSNGHSWLYNVISERLGLIWHGFLGGNRNLITRASWKVGFFGGKY